MNFNHTQTLRLERGVREFHLAWEATLSWDRRSVIEPGFSLYVAEPVWRDYDHRPKVAIPFGSTQELAGFILYEELSPGDQEQIRKLFPGCTPLIAR